MKTVNDRNNFYVATSAIATMMLSLRRTLVLHNRFGYVAASAFTQRRKVLFTTQHRRHIALETRHNLSLRLALHHTSFAPLREILRVSLCLRVSVVHISQRTIELRKQLPKATQRSIERHSKTIWRTNKI